jgi:hypothetical protein
MGGCYSAGPVRVVHYSCGDGDYWDEGDTEGGRRWLVSRVWIWVRDSLDGLDWRVHYCRGIVGWIGSRYGFCALTQSDSPPANCARFAIKRILPYAIRFRYVCSPVSEIFEAFALHLHCSVHAITRWSTPTWSQI